MGIREYFKQHPEEQDLKLQNLNLARDTEKSSEYPLEQYWTGWLKQLNEFRQKENWPRFIYLAENLKVLFPDRVDDLNLSQNILVESKKRLINGYHNNDCQLFIDIASSVKVLFPDSFNLNELDDIYINEDKTFGWLKTKLDLKIESSVALWPIVADWLAEIKIIFPDRVKEFDLEKVRNKLKQEIFKIKNDQDWSEYLRQVHNFRIIFPEYFHELGIGSKEIQELRQQNINLGFVFTAKAFTVINAQDIQITDQGLEIINPTPKNLKPDRKPRPERKKF